METRRQEAEEWRLGRLARGHTQATGKDAGVRFSLPQILISLVARLRAVRLEAYAERGARSMGTEAC